MKDLKHLKTFESFSIVEKKAEVKEKEEKSTSKEDEKKYLSAKQAKLPEGLKKGMIAKAKKAEKSPAKEEKEEDKKEDKKEVKSTAKGDEKYLSAKQAKLPEGLKKGIIAKAKKAEKK